MPACRKCGKHDNLPKAVAYESEVLGGDIYTDVAEK